MKPASLLLNVAFGALVAWAVYVAGCHDARPAGADADAGPTPPDSAPTRDSAAETDASDGGRDSGMTPGDAGCLAHNPFSPYPWAPPTPLHQNACTPAQLAAYVAAAGPYTSGNAACDACLLTDVNAAMAGPVVTQLTNDAAVPVEINFGGCIANLDMDTSVSGCGDQYNGEFGCLFAECATCADFAELGPLSVACANAANATECSTEHLEVTPACQREVNDGGVSVCLASVSSLVTVWCGP
jgi:hypothetical protein